MATPEINYYKSTRGGDKKRYPFSEALLSNTARDGGLLSPEIIPEVSLEELKSLRGEPFPKVLEFILNKFKTGLNPDIVSKASEKAGNIKVVPLKNGQAVSELWQGKKPVEEDEDSTGSFKDKSLKTDGVLHEAVVMEENDRRQEKGLRPLHYHSPTSTSGDTGSSSEKAYSGKKHLSVSANHPEKGISHIQWLQMKTQEGENVSSHAIRGGFTEIQVATRVVYIDGEFIKFLKKHNVLLSSTNSINWARVIPQIAFHFYNYIELMHQGAIHPGEKIDVSIPIGNGGDLISEKYAEQMGLPVGKTLCASNENNVLTLYFRTGVYDIRGRDRIETPSPSMDIVLASNIERLDLMLTKNPEQVAEWMDQQKKLGIYKVDKRTLIKLQKDFYANWVSNEETLTNIGKVYQDTKYLMGTHTSVAQVVAQRYQDMHSPGHLIVVCSTDHWTKNPNGVLAGLRGQASPTELDEFDAIEEVVKLTGEPIPKYIANLREKPILHHTIFDATPQGIRDGIIFDLKRQKLLKNEE